MKQQTMADGNGFEKYTKQTRKEKFLAEMDAIIPWPELVAAIEPFYPRLRPEQAGRRPLGAERMLRIHFIQHWFNLADPAVEDALYDMHALRRFVGIDLGRERVPDETTICKFRHLLERHNLGARFFSLINAYLKANGMHVNRGTIVDATIISAPRSKKNKAKQRDPDMRSTAKGKQWYFGMKAHIGVDSRAKLARSVTCTAANAHDSTEVGNLLHGAETRVWGDSAYTGKKAAITAKAPRARDFTHRRARRGRPLSEAEQAVNSTQVAGAGQGRAPIPDIEAAVRLAQGPLQGLGEEHPPPDHRLRAGQYRARQARLVANAAATTGWLRLKPENHSGKAEKTAKSNIINIPHQGSMPGAAWGGR